MADAKNTEADDDWIPPHIPPWMNPKKVPKGYFRAVDGGQDKPAASAGSSQESAVPPHLQLQLRVSDMAGAVKDKVAALEEAEHVRSRSGSITVGTSSETASLQDTKRITVIDGDGDVVMTDPKDLEDHESVRQVSQAVLQERQSGRTEFKINEVPFHTNRVPNPTCVFIIDTSFILSQAALVNGLVLSHARWRNVVVLPWATIEELDRLKAVTPRSPSPAKGLAGKYTGKNRIDVGKLARWANKWAFNMLSKGEPGVWGQKKEEMVNIMATRGDDAIVDCCRYFHEVLGLYTILLCNDTNLCVKALIYDVKTISFTGVAHTAVDILTRVIGIPPAPAIPAADIPPPALVTSRRSSPIRLNPGRSNRAFHNVASPARSLRGSTSRPVSRAEKTQFDTLQEPSVPIIITSYPRQMSIDRESTPTDNIESQVEEEKLKVPEQKIRVVKKKPLGLKDSIYAPGYRSDDGGASSSTQTRALTPVRPNNQRYGTGSLNRNTGKTQKVKAGMLRLLNRIPSDLLPEIRKIIHQHALHSFGNEETLRQLGIDPERQIVQLIDVETFLFKYWKEVFSNALPYGMDKSLQATSLAKRYNNWLSWACRGSGVRDKPTEYALKLWIEEFDLIWKKLLLTKAQAERNMLIVDEWRAIARGLNL